MRQYSWLALVVAAGCASAQASFTPLVRDIAPRPADHPIEIFRGSLAPVRAFDDIAVVDVHLESTGLRTYSFEEATPKLEAQARLAGADALYAIKETRSRHLETTIYHVQARAARYR